MTARGIRNNNPGNIRVGDDWRGLAEWADMTASQKNEKSFCVFIAPVYGIRALARLLLTYQLRYSLDTVRLIIDRYAPDTENDTNAYAEHVAIQTGFGIDESISLREPQKMHKMLSAIITHENGSNPYTHEIEDGMVLAGLGRV